MSKDSRLKYLTLLKEVTYCLLESCIFSPTQCPSLSNTFILPIFQLGGVDGTDCEYTCRKNGFCSVRNGASQGFCFQPNVQFKCLGIPGLCKPCSQKCFENQQTIPKDEASKTKAQKPGLIQSNSLRSFFTGQAGPSWGVKVSSMRS